MNNLKIDYKIYKRKEDDEDIDILFFKNIIESLKNNLGIFEELKFDDISIEKSPFSNSLYLKFFLNQKSSECYSIRISDHSANDYGYYMLDNCITETGFFSLEKSCIKERLEKLEIAKLKKYFLYRIIENWRLVRQYNRNNVPLEKQYHTIKYRER